MQRLMLRCTRLVPLTLLILAAATLLGPDVAEAQPGHTCQWVEPPEQVCAGEEPGAICTYRYRQCQLDYDHDENFERTLHFFENRGSASDPPFVEAGDRHCFAQNSFDPEAGGPDSAEWGYHRFVLMLPDQYESGSFPLLLLLRGGGQGWVLAPGGTASDAWKLNVSDPDREDWTWERGLYQGGIAVAQASENEPAFGEFLADEDGFAAQLRAAYPNYGMLLPSYCSHDGYNGRPELAQINPAFKNAAETRFGYAAVTEALELVDGAYGIDFLWVAGTSAGGVGAFILAKDLIASHPEFEGRFRGSIADSAPFEPDRYAQLYAEVDNPGSTVDLRRIVVDNNCSGGVTTRVPCDVAPEPLDVAMQEIGLTGRSASEDINPAAGPGAEVPILHLWNMRDQLHCSDACYSESYIHGPIRDAIEARKSDAVGEVFDFSENLEVCFGSCKGDNGKIVNCVRHGLLGDRILGEPIQEVVDCSLEWIAEVNAYWESGGVDPYETPSCFEGPMPTGNLSTKPPKCK